MRCTVEEARVGIISLCCLVRWGQKDRLLCTTTHSQVCEHMQESKALALKCCRPSPISPSHSLPRVKLVPLVLVVLKVLKVLVASLAILGPLGLRVLL